MSGASLNMMHGEVVMAATLRLTVLSGPHKGSRFCLRGQTTCLVGRAPECEIRFCGEPRDQCISRRHCELYFDPPFVRVQDLGSSNGTYINGLKPGTQDGEPLADWFQPGISLGMVRDGDILTLGGISLQANLMDCPPCPSPEDVNPLWQDKETIKKDCAVKC